MASATSYDVSRMISEAERVRRVTQLHDEIISKVIDRLGDDARLQNVDPAMLDEIRRVCKIPHLPRHLMPSVFFLILPEPPVSLSLCLDAALAREADGIRHTERS